MRVFKLMKFFKMVTSTRRLSERPALVPLSAMGLVSPYPMTLKRDSTKPCFKR